MNPVCESHNRPETRYRRARKGNCAAARQGGKHAPNGAAALKAPVALELDSAFAPEEPPSPGRTLRESVIMPGDTTCQSVEAWRWRGGWSKDVVKGTWDNVESLRSQEVRKHRVQAVRGLIVAMKRVTTAEPRSPGK
jgi:hypothetical protein